MPVETVEPVPSRRLAWVDNLRVAIIVGVIGAHVAIISVPFDPDRLWAGLCRVGTGVRLGRCG